jgi:dolichol-phosphate mannosyltransferase
MKPRVSVVVTARDEGETIMMALSHITEAVSLPCEVLVVCDSRDDSTVPWVDKYAREDNRVHLVLNEYGPGPARAIRAGFDAAEADVVVVTMADGCDDPQQIDQLTRLVERGVVVAAASRYSKGGQQVGGPLLKGPTIWLDRTFGESHFKIMKWLPAYLRWYRFAFGPQLSVQQLRDLVDRTGDNK